MGNTHILEKAEVITGQGIEEKQANKWHSLAEELKCQDRLGHIKKVSQGYLPPREGRC